MSTLKMFFCIIDESIETTISIHRELNSIYRQWNEDGSPKQVGLIHIGFVRPKLPSFEEVQHLQGVLLASASFKWSLPVDYRTSDNVAFKCGDISYYLILSGFGYNIESEGVGEPTNASVYSSATLESNKKHTIASAALDVLNVNGRPMSKEEIYGTIIEKNLFQFGAKNPVNVLNVELNRHCKNSTYSHESTNKFFGKTATGLFYALDSKPKEFSDWLNTLPITHPEIAEKCLALKIFNEKTYFENKQYFSDDEVQTLELVRYKKLKKSVNIMNPSELFSILPVSILDTNINQLNLPVRTSNVFSDQNITTLRDAANYTLMDMMTWPNFGKKSAKDLCEIIDSNVENLASLSKINSPRNYKSINMGTKENGWLKEVPKFSSELSDVCSDLTIVDELSYFTKKPLLRDMQIRQLELIRYKELKKLINIQDPSQLIPILPIAVLEAHISQLGLTVRASNVFSIQNIFKLADALDYSLDDMMKWPNFGKKSAQDLCEAIDANVEKLTFILPISSVISDIKRVTTESDNNDVLSNVDPGLAHISAKPLKLHFEDSLVLLKDNQRVILEHRTGYHGSVKTLEEVGEIIGVTRERIRQIQKKSISNIINTEYWDDCITIKVGELLANREEPLYLEMLEIEDEWFTGYMGNYQHLAAIIELFSEDKLKIIKVSGAAIIVRIKQDDWDNLISTFRASLKLKANEGSWNKSDLDLLFKSSLDEKGCSELLPLVWSEFSESLQFNSDGILVSFGKSIESILSVILNDAESPLHFSEIAKRAEPILGRKISDHNVHSRLPETQAKLFGRGTYGLKKFNPIPDTTCQNIIVVVEKKIMEGALNKQWHSSELLNALKEKFPSIPIELDTYLLNIILEDSEKLTYLNKNVWARADSGQKPEDRVDMADAFAKILEDAGTPLKGKEIKDKLKAVRGVHEALQIQSTDRMIQVGPDTWGLIDRDLGGTENSNKQKLDALFSYLFRTQKGIHVSEVSDCLISYNLDPAETSSYALMNLAQRDERFFLARAMFIGLSEWGEDVRRLNYSQAIRKVLQDMYEPMSISEINAKVEMLTGLEVDNSITGVLISEGGRYDSSKRLWEKVSKSS